MKRYIARDVFKALIHESVSGIPPVRAGTWTLAMPHLTYRRVAKDALRLVRLLRMDEIISVRLPSADEEAAGAWFVPGERAW